LTSTFIFAGTETPATSESSHTNGYVYATANLSAAVSVTTGLSADSSRTPGISLNRSQVNPKIGVAWDINQRTTVRAAAFRTMKRFFVASQTIEPTNVAGFNQFFDDGNGTASWRYGMAIDHRAGRAVYAGAEYSRRQNSTPLISGPNEGVNFNDWRESLARAYLYSTFGRDVAITAEILTERVHDPGGNNPSFLVKSLTYKMPLELRLFQSNGLKGRIRATYVRQRGTFLNRQLSAFSGESDFWVADASVGFVFPRQWGIAALDVRNLFDQEFRFQDSDPFDPRIIPGRQVLARVTVTF
jgi:hypothetical protein